MGSIRAGAAARAIGELPGDEEAALSADFHAVKALVEAGNQASHALGKAEGLWRAEFGLSIGAEFGLAVFVEDGGAGVVIRGVELVAVGGQPTGVLHLVELVGGGFSAGSELDVLIAKGEGRLHDSAGWRDAGRKLDGGGCSRGGVVDHGAGCGGSGGLGRGLGRCGHGAGSQKQDHCRRFHHVFAAPESS